MGDKGNKLKPKKSKTNPKENLSISSLAHPGANSVQTLVKNNDSKKAAPDANKKNRKGR